MAQLLPGLLGRNGIVLVNLKFYCRQCVTCSWLRRNKKDLSIFTQLPIESLQLLGKYLYFWDVHFSKCTFMHIII